jgi:hypothetical protein
VKDAKASSDARLAALSARWRVERDTLVGDLVSEREASAAAAAGGGPSRSQRRASLGRRAGTSSEPRQHGNYGSDGEMMGRDSRRGATTSPGAGPLPAGGGVSQRHPPPAVGGHGYGSSLGLHSPRGAEASTQLPLRDASSSPDAVLLRHENERLRHRLHAFENVVHGIADSRATVGPGVSTAFGGQGLAASGRRLSRSSAGGGLSPRPPSQDLASGVPQWHHQPGQQTSPGGGNRSGQQLEPAYRTGGSGRHRGSWTGDSGGGGTGPGYSSMGSVGGGGSLVTPGPSATDARLELSAALAEVDRLVRVRDEGVAIIAALSDELRRAQAAGSGRSMGGLGHATWEPEALSSSGAGWPESGGVRAQQAGGGAEHSREDARPRTHTSPATPSQVQPVHRGRAAASSGDREAERARAGAVSPGAPSQGGGSRHAISTSGPTAASKGASAAAAPRGAAEPVPRGQPDQPRSQGSTPGSSTRSPTPAAQGNASEGSRGGSPGSPAIATASPAHRHARVVDADCAATIAALVAQREELLAILQETRRAEAEQSEAITALTADVTALRAQLAAARALATPVALQRGRHPPGQENRGSDEVDPETLAGPVRVTSFVVQRAGAPSGRGSSGAAGEGGDGSSYTPLQVPPAAMMRPYMMMGVPVPGGPAATGSAAAGAGGVAWSAAPGLGPAPASSGRQRGALLFPPEPATDSGAAAVSFAPAHGQSGTASEPAPRMMSVAPF